MFHIHSGMPPDRRLQADTLYFSREAIEKAQNPKKLFIIPGATHIDMHDKPQFVTPVSDVGFDPVDAGLLRIARYVEPFSMLIGQLAYEGEEGLAVRGGGAK